MADRYAYVPLIGVFIIVAWGLPEPIEKMAPQGQGFDCPSRNICSNINGSDMEPDESLEEQYYHF